MKKLLLASAFACTGFAITSAVASPSDDAKLHFQAVASGDVALLMRGYADNAQFNWVGGPLDGTYVGPDNIRGVWEKFSKLSPLKLTVANLEESANPKGSTVTANVLFEGKQPIKVRYALTYREGKIVGETWQIDPKLALSGY